MVGNGRLDQAQGLSQLAHAGLAAVVRGAQSRLTYPERHPAARPSRRAGMDILRTCKGGEVNDARRLGASL